MLNHTNINRMPKTKQKSIETAPLEWQWMDDRKLYPTSIWEQESKLFVQEFDRLMTAYKVTQYQRFGNYFYAKYVTLKKECSICEFVWNYCRQPRFAAKLTKSLRERIPDTKDMLKLLAKGNRNISLIHTNWNDTFDAVSKTEFKPMSAYCNDYLFNPTNNKKLFLDDTDGELFHGLLIHKDALPNIEWFSFSIYYREYEDRNDFSDKCVYKDHDSSLSMVEFCFDHDDVVEYSKESPIEDYVLYVPFKHPVPIVDFKGVMGIEITLKDQIEPFKEENTFRPVYSVINHVYTDWLRNNAIRIKFFDDQVFIFENGYLTDISKEDTF